MLLLSLSHDDDDAVEWQNIMRQLNASFVAADSRG